MASFGCVFIAFYLLESRDPSQNPVFSTLCEHIVRLLFEWIRSRTQDSSQRMFLGFPVDYESWPWSVHEAVGVPCHPVPRPFQGVYPILLLIQPLLNRGELKGTLPVMSVIMLSAESFKTSSTMKECTILHRLPLELLFIFSLYASLKIKMQSARQGCPSTTKAAGHLQLLSAMPYVAYSQWLIDGLR